MTFQRAGNSRPTFWTDLPSLYFSVERMPPSRSRMALMDGSSSPRPASTRRAISRTVNGPSATRSTSSTAGNMVPRRNHGDAAHIEGGIIELDHRLDGLHRLAKLGGLTLVILDLAANVGMQPN